MPLTAAEVQPLKVPAPVEGVLPVIYHRWSPRSFADKPVALADLAKIFEAARWAASSYNEQPWRYIVGYKGDAAFGKILATLIPFNQSWAQHAAVLILGVASTKFAHNSAPNGYALYDLGAATAHLSLQAAELGLGTHSMAGFDRAAAAAAFAIPEDFAVGVVVALGYQGEPAALGDERLVSMEEAPRTRKPLSDFVFTEWDVPAAL